jgi:hypothetical protein
MRFGSWREVTRALALASTIAIGFVAPARAGLFFQTIPRLTPAEDYSTGGPYYAPPIPYGHYAGKDFAGALRKRLGCKACGGLFHGGKGGLCGGSGAGDCQGGGCGGNQNCGACGGTGCGFCAGRGLFRGKARSCGLIDGAGPCSAGFASTIAPTAQAVVAAPAASLQYGHQHGMGAGCGLCGGLGCNACQGPVSGGGDPCGNCGGKGCGLCGGKGSKVGKGCANCGGLGCKLCLGPRALLGSLLRLNRVKYFVGAGGPVPLTPGYVPYVVPTRSPRDFLAFPPFSPLDP